MAAAAQTVRPVEGLDKDIDASRAFLGTHRILLFLPLQLFSSWFSSPLDAPSCPFSAVPFPLVLPLCLLFLALALAFSALFRLRLLFLSCFLAVLHLLCLFACLAFPFCSFFCVCLAFPLVRPFRWFFFAIHLRPGFFAFCAFSSKMPATYRLFLARMSGAELSSRDFRIRRSVTPSTG